MSLKLLTPKNEETITLLIEEHRKFIENEEIRAKNEDDSFDWMNLVKQGTDASFPVPVIFRWKPEMHGGNRKYFVLLSERGDFKNCHRIEERSNTGCALAENLKIGTRYFWKVIARGKAGIATESEVRSFVTADMAPRWLHVEGITNVRDAGGWKTVDGKRIRQGLLYRGSELETHVTITNKGLRVLREDLGIRTDLDLRSEIIGKRKESILGRDINWVVIPIKAYRDFLSEDQLVFCRKIFPVLCDRANYPIYYHCWGGADRTGTIAFLLGAILGIKEEDLILDYELTSFSVWGYRLRSNELFSAFRVALDSYGGLHDSIAVKAEKFLLSAGVTADQISTIRSILLTK